MIFLGPATRSSRLRPRSCNYSHSLVEISNALKLFQCRHNHQFVRGPFQRSADPTECAHIDTIKSPFDNTNCQYGPQICPYLDRDKRGVSSTLSQPSTRPGETWNSSSITQLVTRLMVIMRDWTTNRVWIGSPSPIPPAWLVAHPKRRWTCLQVPILGRVNHVQRSYGHTTAIAHLFNRLGRLQRPPEPEFLSIPSHANTISLTFA